MLTLLLTTYHPHNLRLEDAVVDGQYAPLRSGLGQVAPPVRGPGWGSVRLPLARLSLAAVEQLHQLGIGSITP